MSKASVTTTWVVVVLIAYVLSIGPAAVLVDHHVLPEDVANLIYFPLLCLVKVPVASTVLVAYVDWFESFFS